MKLLLDSHALLWTLTAPEQLAPGALAEIRSLANEVYVSAASAWELGIKQALGKLALPPDLDALLARNGYRPLSITLAHALAAAALPRHHGDPFDRMLVAQARVEHFTLVTRDDALGAYDVATLLA